MPDRIKLIGGIIILIGSAYPIWYVLKSEMEGRMTWQWYHVGPFLSIALAAAFIYMGLKKNLS